MKKMKLFSSLMSLGVVAGAVPLVATACDSGDNDEVIEGYSIKCMTADGDTLTTQPGQFEKFALFYKGTQFSYDDEPYIFWSVEVIGGDKSVSPVFMDNYIGAQGCGYLYVSYLNSANWKPGKTTQIRITASSYEHGKVYARKTVNLTRSTRTFYTPVDNDLTLMNTVQFIDTDESDKFPLKLNEDLGTSVTEVKNVKWTLDNQLSTPALAGILAINDNDELYVSGALPSTTTYATGYLTFKAEVPDYNKPLYFCTNATIAKNKITYDAIPDGTSYRIPGAPYNYCNYFFIPIQKTANTQPTPLFEVKYDETQSPAIKPLWTVNLKKNAVVYTGVIQPSIPKPEGEQIPIMQLAANQSDFKSECYISGTINLYDYSSGTNKLVMTRNVVISVVDQDTFEAIKNL